ncbi:MAG: HAMP domain-containing protein, partial [Oligoflexales bacterium]|nr:HAMP domain-containing protein [Oligoflexales bacterium]
MRSIRSKLVLNSVLIISLAFAVTTFITVKIVDELVTIFKSITSKNGEEISEEISGIFSDNKIKIKELIEEQVEHRSKALISEAELVLAPAFTEGSFSFISEVMSERIRTEKDIIYTAFFSHDGVKTTLWTLNTPDSNDELVFGAYYNSQEKAWLKEADEEFRIPDEKIQSVIGIDTFKMEKIEYEYKDDLGNFKKVEAFDVYTPVFSKDEEQTSQTGYVRYVISLEKINSLIKKEEALAIAAKEKNQQKLASNLENVALVSMKSYKNSLTYLGVSALLMLALSSYLFYLFANRITVPLLKLRSIAAQISDGDYNTVVDVVSKDEVGALSVSFDQMRHKVKMFTEHLQALVDERTAQLREALGQVTEEKQKIQEILTHIEQGIVMFDENLTISAQYSEHVKEIFSCESQDFVGKDVFDFLFHNAKSDQEMLVRNNEALRMSVADDYLAWIGNEAHFIKEVQVEVNGDLKYLTLNWHPIKDGEDIVKKVIVSFFDITQKRKLEAEVAEERLKNKRLMDAIAVILPQDPAQIKEFIDSSIDQLGRILIEISAMNDGQNLDNSVMQRLHTIKGNSRVFEMSDLTILIHDTETLITSGKESDGETWLSIIVRHLNLSLEILDVYKDVFVNVLKLSKEGQGTSNLFGLLASRVKEVMNRVEKERLAFDSISCDDEVGLWPSSLLAKVSDILTHAIANSIDHGYVRPRTSGKQIGPYKLSIAAKNYNEGVIIEVRD